jgi:broad specificity phosphatase PhoE
MSNWDLNSDLDNGVETIQDMYFKRIKPFIDQIIKIHSKKTIVVVAHSWVGRLFNFYFSNKDKSTIAITPKNGVPIKYKI